MDEGGFSNVTAEAFLAFLHIACDKRAEIMYNKITENRIEKNCLYVSDGNKSCSEMMMMMMMMRFDSAQAIFLKDKEG